MNSYKYKAIDYGFIVLCPDYNISQIKITVDYLRSSYSEAKSICVVPDKCPSKDFKEIKKYTLTEQGGKEMTSLINVGMKYTPCQEWNFIITSGSWLKNNLNYNFCKFIENEKDILYPIVGRKCNFVDGTMNGMLIHKRAFDEIGPFMENNTIDFCKLMWSVEAIEKGYRFKGVVGGVLR